MIDYCKSDGDFNTDKMLQYCSLICKNSLDWLWMTKITYIKLEKYYIISLLLSVKKIRIFCKFYLICRYTNNMISMNIITKNNK